MNNIKISLKAARINKGMNQKDAAKAIGICKETLIKWESGKTAPDGLKLIQMCELYGIPLNCIRLQNESTLSR